jgi:osmotically-inducible protein OsmY
LSARVKRRLEQSGYYSVRKINIHEHEGVLTLYGSVSSFYLKQVAQAAAAGVPGVEQIHNRVQVVEPIR